MDASWMAALQALGGGVLIGLASWLLLAALGRVAGISGIAAAALSPSADERGDAGGWRKMFLLGLILGGAAAFAWIAPPAAAARPWPLLVAAGLLVGVGTVMGSGCTSGHGVCGLGRRSARSLVATLSFMGAGVATVTAMQFIAARA
ncbi:MAG: YeeE/YedE family protein [Burkholderiales bacterium]|nr:MAG: YeeE/YedE family protein [Burkholderiales bacterium]